MSLEEIEVGGGEAAIHPGDSKKWLCPIRGYRVTDHECKETQQIYTRRCSKECLARCTAPPEIKKQEVKKMQEKEPTRPKSTLPPIPEGWNLRKNGKIKMPGSKSVKEPCPLGCGRQWVWSGVSACALCRSEGKGTHKGRPRKTAAPRRVAKPPAASPSPQPPSSVRRVVQDLGEIVEPLAQALAAKVRERAAQILGLA